MRLPCRHLLRRRRHGFPTAAALVMGTATLHAFGATGAVHGALFIGIKIKRYGEGKWGYHASSSNQDHHGMHVCSLSLQRHPPVPDTYRFFDHAQRIDTIETIDRQRVSERTSAQHEAGRECPAVSGQG